jgi:hypothetical protein
MRVARRTDTRRRIGGDRHHRHSVDAFQHVRETFTVET